MGISGRQTKPLLIKSIEVSGVADPAISTGCKPCHNGTHAPAPRSRQCQDCPADSYSNRGATQCTRCDAKTSYAAPGSGRCHKRPPCTQNYYFEVGNKREKKMSITSIAGRETYFQTLLATFRCTRLAMNATILWLLTNGWSLVPVAMIYLRRPSCRQVPNVGNARRVTRGCRWITLRALVGFVRLVAHRTV